MLSIPFSTLLTLSFSANVVVAYLPQVDFDRMGTVGLAGAFAGLDIFQNSSTVVSFDPSTASLLSRSSDGALTYLASTNPGGKILAGCALSGQFYLAGSFSSIGGISARNVASYSPSTSKLNALGSDGPNGEVYTVFCDVKDNKVWVGGTFTSPGSSVAVWDLQSGLWSPPPFVGVSGANSTVLSITTNTSDTSLFFAGSFITSFQGNSPSIANGSHNPNVPFSSGATPFTSSLVPIPLQDAQVDGSPSSTDPRFSSVKNILCPSGADGPGNTWLGEDGNTALVTIRTFTFTSANGIRLGNTFLSAHGTTSFSLTTIPDNKVQNLHYVDPTTGQTQTCSDPCPLATDPTILYQDFLFDGILAITGVQIKLSGFVGAAPGLHILQLLSSGAFASSIDSNNLQSCFAPNPSNTTRTGDWVTKLVNTGIAGTTQTVLVSTVDTNTSPGTGPTITWIPYVSASGDYDINLLVPGCTNFPDCPLRTNVKVTVFPGEGLQPWVSSISQQNTADSSILIYSGPILLSSPKSVATISMTLADNPIGSGQNGKYELVADRVQLVLKSADTTSNGGVGSNGSVTGPGVKLGFGFLEWPRDIGAGSSIKDGTKILPNTSQTFFDTIGFDLFAGLGGRSSTIASVVHHDTGAIFLGGDFTIKAGPVSGAANIAIFKSGRLSRVSDMGLNGPVATLALHSDKLFVGGTFNNTVMSSGTGLNNIAIYDISKDTWNPLGAGVNGEVTSLAVINGQLQVVGNFTLLNPVNGDVGTSATGLAVWDLAKASWVNSGGFLVGRISFIGNDTSSQMIAGNVAVSQRFGASGLVLLKNGDKDGPKITPLGVQLESTTNSGTTKANRSRRRSHTSRTTSWIPHVKQFFSRQTPAPLEALPMALPAPAPAVLAGVFWTNSSVDLAIIGGNFSFQGSNTHTQSEAVAIYDPISGAIQGLIGAQINGTVRALLVNENLLYIGGEFGIQGTNVDGLAVYDLSMQQWDTDSIQALQPISGSKVVVRSITTFQTKTIIVAGSFAQAGSLRCQSICTFDTTTKQWNPLGNGIQGEVASIAFGGTNQELLIASGSIALSDNSKSNVAQFSFANTTWTALGTPSELPGPVTAIEVNAGNVNSIFAAGSSSDGLSFLSFWNGILWSNLGSALKESTVVSQLAMVPLQDTHSANGVIEPDRMLMVSGLLSESSFGNASSVLFDGESFIPYIVSTSASGTPGTVASLFRSLHKFPFGHRHLLATGVVILISIAIAAGIVFLLALIGILWTLFSRRDDKLNKMDPSEEDDDDSTHHRPSSLLEHINAATRTTILGASPFANVSAEKEDKIGRETEDPFGPDASNYMRAETPSDAVGGILAEETSRPAHARYSFDGAGEGELAISAGAEVEVLDDRDPAWWYARDVRTGREGVVPAAYLY